MRTPLCRFLLAGFFASAIALSARAGITLEDCNVSWTTPSENAHGSMPLGNGDIGINAWVEPSGDLVFYTSKTDAWDENGRLCKIGRIRVRFEPPLPVAEGFRQELKLRNGSIEISSKDVSLSLWVDANEPVVRLESKSASPRSCSAVVELWRLRERPFGDDDDSHCGKGLGTSKHKATVLPDVVVTSDEPNVIWYHRNTRSIFDLNLEVQQLGALKNQFPDPLLNLTFGASLTGPGFARDGAHALKSRAPARHHRLAVTVLTAQAADPQAWVEKLRRIEKSSKSFSRRDHDAWWHKFWDRSWVFVDGAPEAQAVTRAYVLQRFMNACSGRGGSPIKFNGSIFTVEDQPGASPETPKGDPDWRRWGGNYWFQNTRLAYWPMLASGDFEFMDPWFGMYDSALPLSKARVRSYYQFTNAAVFPETMYWWGLPNNSDYGWENTAPEPANTYISRYWSGNLELIAVMLDRYEFTGDRRFVKDTLLPLADPLISFMSQYWAGRDSNGRIRIDPAQSLETWHSAVNPLPEIAGLKIVLPRLLDLPGDLISAGQRTRWQKMLNELPEVPIAEVNGRRVLRPAESFSRLSNSENPELYAVFPFRLYGTGREDLDLARNTYAQRANRANMGWCQDSIQAACLGLSEEAARLLVARVALVNKGHRFPAMWGPNFDWIPDQDHGNNILNTVHNMLLQSEGSRLFLLPAWPANWEVSFKLHAPNKTTVNGTYRQGKLENLSVTPHSRRKDLVLPK